MSNQLCFNSDSPVVLLFRAGALHGSRLLVITIRVGEHIKVRFNQPNIEFEKLERSPVDIAVHLVIIVLIL